MSKTRKLINAANDGDVGTVKILIFEGVDVNAEGFVEENRKQAIHWAAMKGRKDVIEAMFNTRKLNIESTDRLNFTALNYAAQECQIPLIEFFVDKLADCNKGTDTPLHEILQYCADSCCLKTKNSNCKFLNLASECSHIQEIFNEQSKSFKTKCMLFAVAQFLIEKGFANLITKNRNGKTAIDYIPVTCSERPYFGRLYQNMKSKRSVLSNFEKGDLNAVQKLIFEGFDISGTDTRGNTAAHYCVSANKTEILNLLIKHGIDIDATNWVLMTPLHTAAMSTSVECMEILLKLRCDVNSQDLFGETALMKAIMRSKKEDTFLQSRQEGVIVMLTESSTIDFNLVDKYGKNCAHYAVQSDNQFAIEILRNKAPCIFKQADNDRNQPLHLAAMSKKTEMAKLIVETTGVDINCNGYFNRSPLHFALFNENFEVIELLVSKAANCNSIDEESNTPLHIAFQKFNECCYKSYLLFWTAKDCKHKLNTGTNRDICKVFDRLPDTFKSFKCAFFAVAEYFITKGEADISAKNSQGKSPLELIDPSQADRSQIISYFTVLHASGIAKIRDIVSHINLEDEMQGLKTNVVTLQNVVQETTNALEVFRENNFRSQNLIVENTDELGDLKTRFTEFGQRAEIEKEANRAIQTRFEELAESARNEISELKAKIEFLASNECCEMCKHSVVSIKALCGRMLCDECFQKHENCNVCKLIRKFT